MSSYLVLFFFFFLSALTITSTLISISCVDSDSFPSAMPERRGGKGRLKIQMKKIENEAARLVTFSKRRAGIYNKTSELCTLCGAEAAILVFSPAGNLFSFGYPSVESTLDRYLNEGTPQEEAARLVDAYRVANVGELHRRYADLVAEVEEEKEKAKNLKATVDATNNGDSCWKAPMEELSLTDLKQLKFALSLLKKNIARQIDQMAAQVSFPSPVLAINSVGMADPSVRPSQSTMDTMNNVNDAAIGPHGFRFGFQNAFEHGSF